MFIVNSRYYMIYPQDTIRIYQINDRSDSGNSEIVDFMTDNKTIHLEYLLKEGFAFPYVGLGVELLYTNNLSTSGFDYFTIRAQASNKTSLKINIITRVDTDSQDTRNSARDISYYYYTSIIDVESKFTEVTIPLSEFSTPEWFLVKHKIKKQSIDPMKSNPIWAVEILTSSIDTTDTVQSITIDHMSLEKDLIFYIIISAITLLIAISLCVFIYQMLLSQKAVKNARDVIRIHSNLDLGNEKEREAAKLFEYLSAHYNDPYISVQQVADAQHISPYKVPKIITIYTKLSFKQYINLIRVDEAKNLLLNSDSKIIDIAFAVGYNSIAHFNKLFKGQEQLSPKEFRQKHKA
ncbi:MAG: AraC family transcriptional regulator [Spirochaetes bacterium]|nr:AraC family transcriptional regulator [Spirochaetota bacterium]